MYLYHFQGILFKSEYIMLPVQAYRKGHKYGNILKVLSLKSSTSYSKQTHKIKILFLKLICKVVRLTFPEFFEKRSVRHFTLYWELISIYHVHSECKLMKCLYWSSRYHRVFSLLKKWNALELNAWCLIRFKICYSWRKNIIRKKVYTN